MDLADWPSEQIRELLVQNGVDVTGVTARVDLVTLASDVLSGDVIGDIPVMNVAFVDNQGVEYIQDDTLYDASKIDPQTLVDAEAGQDRFLYYQNYPAADASESFYIPPENRLSQTLNAGVDSGDIELKESEQKRLVSEKLADSDDETVAEAEDSFDVEGSMPPPTARPLKGGKSQIVLSDKGIEESEHDDWVPPDEEELERFLRQHSVMKRGDGIPHPYPVCSTHTGRFCCQKGRCSKCNPLNEQASELVGYGVGISSYYKFVKWLGWTFFFMGLLSVPQITINTFGTAQVYSITDIKFASLSLGNLGSASLLNDTIVPPWCSAPGPACPGITRQSLGQLYGSFDVLTCLLFIGAYAWLSYFQSADASRVATQTCTAADYTVQVVRVPPQSTEGELEEFFSNLVGEEVGEVHLAQDNSELINKYKHQGDLLRKLEHAVALVRMHRHKEASSATIKQAVHRRNEIYRQWKTARGRIATITRGEKSLSAFVTFESELGAIKCLQEYPNNPLNYICQPRRKRLNGQRLRVRRAPPPSCVIWENMEYGWCNRLGRRTFTVLVTFLVLLCSLAVVFLAMSQQRKISGQCDTSILYTKAFVNASATPSVARTCLCMQQVTSNPYILASAYCAPVLQQILAAYTYTVLASFVTVGTNQLLSLVTVKLAAYEKHHSIVNRERSVMFRVFLGQSINTGMLILLVNAQFSGQSFISLLLSGVAPSAVSALQSDRTYADFNSGWYSGVGNSICFTMVLNAMSPHAAPIAKYLLARCSRKCKTPVTQRELNELHLGDEFELSSRYAQLLQTSLVLLMYSGGMPVMYLIGCVSFFVTYWVDKFLFLRFYRRPPHFDEKLGRSAMMLLRWILLLHISVTLWMLSVETILPSTALNFVNNRLASVILQSEGIKRINSPNVLPLFVLFVMVVVLWLLRNIVQLYGNVLKQIFVCNNRVLGLIPLDAARIRRLRLKKRQTLFPDYHRAIQKGVLRGIPNHNILKNPVYQRAFAINDDFADEHSHVGSVAHMDAGAGSAGSMANVRRGNGRRA